MISSRNPFNDIETKRQLRNSTSTQQKNLINTKQGVIINTYEGPNGSLSDLKNDYIIPDKADLPQDLFQSTNPQKDKKRNDLKNPLLLLAALTLLLTGGVAGATTVAKKVAKSKLKIPKLNSLEDIKVLTENTVFKKQYKDYLRHVSEELPDLGRNMNLNKEEYFVSYMLVRNPDIKTVMATSAFFAFSAAGVVLKNFVDGAKSIWVKKQESDADKDLQEHLIDVETRVFQGKNQIIRNLLSSTSQELQEIEKSKKSDQRQQTFSSFLGGQNFGKSTQAEKVKNESKVQSEDKKSKKWLYPLIAAGTILSSVGLAAVSYKNIKKVDAVFGEVHDGLLKNCQELFDKSAPQDLKKYENNIKDLLLSFNFKSSYADNVLKKVGTDDATRADIVAQLTQRNHRFSDSCVAMGGYSGKLQFYAYNDDAKGHFYNWMMNLSSKPLGILSMLITAVSGVGYVGNEVIEGVKDAEVKKAAKETELNLQKSLINTELKNFYSKKQSYIAPLMADVKRKSPDLNDEELKKMADNVLFEIKNGPPFVYS